MTQNKQISLLLVLLSGALSAFSNETTILSDPGGTGPIPLENPDFEMDVAMASGTPGGWQWNESGGRGTSAGGTAGSLLF